MNIDNIIDNVLTTGVYKDGLGKSRKLPSNEFEREFVFKAIRKSCRKTKRNLALYANTWIGNEHGVPQASIKGLAND